MREEILRLIEKNSRIDIHEMAILLGAKEAEVANAIADMENEGVICGYYTLIDWDKTNDEKVTALIEVRVTPQRGSGFDEIAERIYKFEEVKAVYLMSGGFDFTVILEEKTMKEIAQFVSSKLSTLDSILNTATHFVLRRYKDHGVIFDEKKLDDDIRCPLEYGLAIFGGKWKSRIISVLSAAEKLRYSELRREMCNITDTVLAATLKDLIEVGIVERKSYDEIPPRVEYMLTQKGKSVVPILQNICQWSGVFYKDDVENEMLQCQRCDHNR